MILDANSDGSFTKYLNGLGIDNKLSLKSNGVTNYFTQDHLGSTNALTDASGNVTSSASYDSFGNSTGNLNTRYAYTGREYDVDTGLYYYRARFYDAKLGRFISEDPIGLGGGINQFGYVGGNPLSFRDPSGKIPILIPVVIGIGILIVTSPSYVNAPGPGDPVYLDDKGSGLFINAATGMGCSFLLKRVGGPVLNRVISGSGNGIIELGISRGSAKTVKPTFSSGDLAYGPSANGALNRFAVENGVETLNFPRFQKPPGTSWEDFSVQIIEETATSGKTIHFDLTYVKDINGVLSGTGTYANKVTSAELRYIQANWSRLSKSVIFYKNGGIVAPPW